MTTTQIVTHWIVSISFRVSCASRLRSRTAHNWRVAWYRRRARWNCDNGRHGEYHRRQIARVSQETPSRELANRCGLGALCNCPPEMSVPGRRHVDLDKFCSRCDKRVEIGSYLDMKSVMGVGTVPTADATPCEHCDAFVYASLSSTFEYKENP